MILAIKFLDKYVGGIICRVLSTFSKLRKANEAGKINKILVIQLWGIGESILTLPAISALKEKFPRADIDVLATKRNADVYFSNKSINKTIKLNFSPFSITGFISKNFKKYDLAVDMEEYLHISSIMAFFAGNERIGYSHGIRSKLYTKKADYHDRQHAVQTFLDLVRILGADYKKDSLASLNYGTADKKNADEILKKNKIRRNDFVIGIAPGAAESAKARMWPYDRYAELSNILIEKYNAKIFFVGDKEESNLSRSIIEKIDKKENAVNLAGKISLRELFYFITKCKLFVGNDAGAMHIAAAQGTKTIGLFGPNLPVRFGPYGKSNVAIYKGFNCEFSPCINVHKGEVPDCLYPKLSRDYQKCMKNISVGDVLNAVDKIRN